MYLIITNPSLYTLTVLSWLMCYWETEQYVWFIHSQNMQNSSRFILTCFQMRLKDDAFMCPKFQRVFFLSAFAAPSILNIWIRHRDVTHADGYACVEPGAKHHKDGWRCWKWKRRDLPAYMQIKTGGSDLTWSLRVSTELQTSCSNCTTYFSLLPGPRSASQISLSMGGGCVMLHISTRDPSFSCRLGL